MYVCRKRSNNTSTLDDIISHIANSPDAAAMDTQTIVYLCKLNFRGACVNVGEQISKNDIKAGGRCGDVPVGKLPN